MIRCAVITVSTSKSRGEGEDESGPALAAALEGIGAEIIQIEIVPDDRKTIAERLRHWVEQGVELVATTGGTGFAPNDLTPEATRDVIERQAPGLAEAMRAASASHTPHGWLSRAVAGTRGKTLIVNFPGSPKAVEQCFAAVAESLPHAIGLLSERQTEHE